MQRGDHAATYRAGAVGVALTSIAFGIVVAFTNLIRLVVIIVVERTTQVVCQIVKRRGGHHLRVRKCWEVQIVLRVDKICQQFLCGNLRF